MHTRNCTGHHHQVLATVPSSAQTAQPPRAETKGQVVFRVPTQWICANGQILEYLDWYMKRLGCESIPAVTRSAWAQLESKMAFIKHMRPLTIYVLAEDSTSPLVNNPDAFVNVHARGLNAHAPELYNMIEVTGIDFDVQAVLVSQPLTAEILYNACRNIELQELDTFAFVCSHATHRSCGCAMLLSMLVYWNARIVFSTNRTRRAARLRGMIEAGRT